MGIWVCDVRLSWKETSLDEFYVAHLGSLIGSNPVTPTIPPNKCWDHVTRLKQINTLEFEISKLVL